MRCKTDQSNRNEFLRLNPDLSIATASWKNKELGSPGMQHEGVSDDEHIIAQSFERIEGIVFFLSLLLECERNNKWSRCLCWRVFASFSANCVWKTVEIVDLCDCFIFYWRTINSFQPVNDDSQEIKEVDGTYFVATKTLTPLHAHALVVFASLRNKIRWVEQCELNDAILIHSYRSIGEISHCRHRRSRAV